MDRGASSSKSPAPRVVGHTTRAPAADESLDSHDSRAPLKGTHARNQSHESVQKTNENGLSPTEVNVAMHYLDTLNHATDWLKQHELERSKIPLTRRLTRISTGNYLPALAEVSISRRREFQKRRTVTLDEKMQQFQQYVTEQKHGVSPTTSHDQDVVNSKKSILSRVSQDELSRDSGNSMKADTGFVSDPIAESDRERVLELQRDEFWIGVHQETAVVPEQLYGLPRGFVVPCCECEIPCSLRRYAEDTNVLHQVWFCSQEVCMACVFYNSIDSHGNICNANGMNVQAEYTHDNPLGPEEDRSVSAHSLSYQHELESSEQETVANTIFGRLNLEQFWQQVNKSQVPLDNNTTQFISHQLSTHTCDCGLVCNLVFCIHSGGIFSVCSKQACFCIFTVLKRSALLQLDVGQIVQFGDSCLDRYTTWTHAMRWFGFTFTEKFIHRQASRRSISAW